MEAPKCKICGERHYGLCVDHSARGNLAARSTESQTKAFAGNAASAEGKITPKRAEPKRAKPAGREMQVGAAGGAGAPDLTTRGTPRKRAPKGSFDRKAYQREKARERRARLKAEKK